MKPIVARVLRWGRELLILLAVVSVVGLLLARYRAEGNFDLNAFRDLPLYQAGDSASAAEPTAVTPLGEQASAAPAGSAPPGGLVTRAPFSPRSWQGRKLIVYAWATWCGVCKAQLPFVKSAARGLRAGESPAFLSLEEGAGKDELLAYIRAGEVEFPIVSLRGNSEALRALKIDAFPTTLFVDETGRIVFKEVGFLSPWGFWIRRLLL